MRSIWSGTIGFGLVHIPVNLYSATEEKKLKFRYLREGDLCPIRFMKVCRDDGKEVSYDEIVRGYEYQKGDYVVLYDEDFEKADIKKTHSIEIVEFVKESEVAEKYMEKPYYLAPSKGAEKSFTLLREALRRSKKVGIARFILRKHEHLAIVKAEKDIILLNQLRFVDQVRDPGALKIEGKIDYSKKELDIALQLINQLTGSFKPEEFKDTYTESLLKIIDKKAKGKTVRISIQMPVPTEMPDIMERLKKSLKEAKKKK